jgi:hypothetical protein
MTQVKKGKKIIHLKKRSELEEKKKNIFAYLAMLEHTHTAVGGS